MEPTWEQNMKLKQVNAAVDLVYVIKGIQSDVHVLKRKATEINPAKEPITWLKLKEREVEALERSAEAAENCTEEIHVLREVIRSQDPYPGLPELLALRKREAEAAETTAEMLSIISVMLGRIDAHIAGIANCM